MPFTYGYGSSPTNTLIASTTIGSTVSSYTFSNLPQGYTDLVVIMEIQGTSSGEDVYYRFNGDSGSNYASAWIRAVGGTASSGNSGSLSGARLSDGGSQTTSNRSLIISNIQGYSTNIGYKSILTRANNVNRGLDYVASSWRNSAAITSLTVYIGIGSIASGNIYVYGIKSAQLSPKAIGGDIIKTDGTYWYHAFLYSGSFRPNQAITADMLVVAGGGGGGADTGSQAYYGGGGGAGGLLNFTSQSLSANTPYAVTVGAGGGWGASGQGRDSRGLNGSNSQFGSLTAAVGGGGGAGGGDSHPAWINGKSGGSGGGGQSAVGTGGFGGGVGGAGTSGQGNQGGNGAGAWQIEPQAGGGGGGATAAGSNAANAGTGGNGGAGSSAYSSWGRATGTGHWVSGTVWYAGGGGGASNGTPGTGGNGGGGNGGGNRGIAALAHTGGGGGNGRPGGSGIVIVRYAV